MRILHGIQTVRNIYLGVGVNGMEAHVHCPVRGTWVEIGACVGCDHYRGLSRELPTGRRLRCNAVVRELGRVRAQA